VEETGSLAHPSYKWPRPPTFKVI